MNLPHDFDSSAFDDRVRSAFDADDQGGGAPPPTPSLRVWQGLQPHLVPPAPVVAPFARRATWTGALGGLVVGTLLTALLGWWHFGTTITAAQERGVGAPHEPTVTAAAPISRTAIRAPQAANAPATATSRAASSVQMLPVSASALATNPVPTTSLPLTEAVLPVVTASGAPPASTASTSLLMQSADSVKNGPASIASVPAIALPFVQTEQLLMALGTDSTLTARERRRDALLMQRATLVRLQFRTDSLLLALGEQTITAGTKSDSTPVAPLKNRWSVALSFAPERNFFGLSAPAADTLAALRRTHEQGRGGYNAALMAEYRLTDRLSVGAGVGTSAYGAELRLTDHRTTVTTAFDTVRSFNTQTNTITSRAWAIRRVRDSLLSPIVNFNNQIVGYQYLQTTRLDTVWTNLVRTEVVKNTTETYQPTVTTRQEISARILRPNYRFLTLPLLIRYRLGRTTDWTSSPSAPRWWADVAVGTQWQFFLGGTQLITRDGLTYQTERIGSSGGPFRPLNVALTGSLAFNYALTPRLSASLAPTLRYQVESVYKASTNLTQKPTATGVQMGLRYAF